MTRRHVQLPLLAPAEMERVAQERKRAVIRAVVWLGLGAMSIALLLWAVAP